MALNSEIFLSWPPECWINGVSYYHSFQSGVVVRTITSHLGRQSQLDLFKFKDSLFYKVSCRIAKAEESKRKQKEKGCKEVGKAWEVHKICGDYGIISVLLENM